MIAQIFFICSAEASDVTAELGYFHFDKLPRCEAIVIGLIRNIRIGI